MPDQPRLFPDRSDSVSAKSLTRMERRRLQAAAEIADHDPEAFFCHHSLLCQTSLPYRDPSPRRTWEHRNGRAGLLLEAGQVWDPDREIWVARPLPFGTRPRLTLIHLGTEALKKGSPEVEVDRSLTAFARRVLARPPTGPQLDVFRDQLTALAACRVTLGFAGENNRGVTLKTDFIKSLELWNIKEEGQKLLWPSTLRLSDSFFDDLTRHPVPLDERAIRALANSPMGLDVYCWLAQKLHRVKVGRPALIPWPALKAQFGVEFDRMDNFRNTFRAVLGRVAAAYPDSRVDLETDGVRLHHSPPPVPRRATFQLIRPSGGAAGGRAA